MLSPSSSSPPPASSHLQQIWRKNKNKCKQITSKPFTPPSTGVTYFAGFRAFLSSSVYWIGTSFRLFGSSSSSSSWLKTSDTVSFFLFDDLHPNASHLVNWQQEAVSYDTKTEYLFYLKARTAAEDSRKVFYQSTLHRRSQGEPEGPWPIPNYWAGYATLTLLNKVIRNFTIYPERLPFQHSPITLLVLCYKLLMLFWGNPNEIVEFQKKCDCVVTNAAALKRRGELLKCKQRHVRGANLTHPVICAVGSCFTGGPVLWPIFNKGADDCSGITNQLCETRNHEIK